MYGPAPRVHPVNEPGHRAQSGREPQEPPVDYVAPQVGCHVLPDGWNASATVEGAAMGSHNWQSAMNFVDWQTPASAPAPLASHAMTAMPTAPQMQFEIRPQVPPHMQLPLAASGQSVSMDLDMEQAGQVPRVRSGSSQRSRTRSKPKKTKKTEAQFVLVDPRSFRGYS